MKKAIFVIVGFMFCVSVPSLAENYRGAPQNIRTTQVISRTGAIALNVGQPILQ